MLELLEPLARHLLLQGLPHFLNASPLDELGQLKGRLLNAPLPLQVLPLEAPVTRHRHSVACGFQVHQQLGLLCSDIMHLHHVWPGHQLTGEIGSLTQNSCSITTPHLLLKTETTPNLFSTSFTNMRLGFTKHFLNRG